MMTPSKLFAKIDALFLEQGGDRYFGEAVTQLEHALQSAWFAEQDGHSPSLIVAALLHDIGHLLQAEGEDYLERGVDDRHEDLAARFLAHGFGAEVTETVGLHVAAKRYLVVRRTGYLEQLSPASVASLALQGGPMSDDEATAFEQLPYAKEAAVVREYDDRAKVVGLKTPPYEHFRQYFAAVRRED